MGPEIRWLHSYVTGDKLFLYILRLTKRLFANMPASKGFPANRISAVRRLIRSKSGWLSLPDVQARSSARFAIRCLFDGFLQRHCPPFHPGRQTRRATQRTTREFQCLFKSCLISWSERCPQSPAKGSGCARPAQSLLSVRLRRGTRSEALKHSGHAPFVSQVPEQPYALRIQAARFPDYCPGRN